jgi:putative ABC transport system permease protein
VAGQKVTVTGILPQSEYAAQAAWQSVALFSNKHVGCKKACGPDSGEAPPEALAAERAISDLQPDEVILGADVAEACGAELGQTLEVMGVTFSVLAKLPRTGTVDDSRVFAHLHTIQRLAEAGEVVNAIEVCACCQDAASTLVPELTKLLPDAKIVTIANVVSTQVGVNRLMSQVSILILGILVTIGGASVASTISANVRDRRREIGTLMAIGATPRLVAGMFLLKAAALGAVGALAGCLIGTVAAILLGTHWAGVAIRPLPALSLAAIAAALLVTTFAAFWPARTAAKLDPCFCFRES